MIEQCTGYFEYNQIIIFNKISSVEEITFVNVKEINKEKMERISALPGNCCVYL